MPGFVLTIPAGIPFFRGMDRSKLKLLAFTSERHKFEPGQILFRQGDMGDNAYLIVEEIGRASCRERV